MKTISQVLKTAKLGDVLKAGRRRWVVVDVDYDGCIIAKPTNVATKFELWSEGIENAAIIPGLQVVKRAILNKRENL
jgi:hypothetical protein